MDNKTLALSYIVVAIAVFLASMLIAIIRKEQYFKIFGYSFLSSAIGVSLFAGQGGTIFSYFSLILGNTMMLLSYLLLVCGLREFYKELIRWPKHFWTYIIVFFLGFIFASFIHDSYNVRVIVFTTFLVIIMMELYFYLRPKLLNIPRLIRNGFQFVIFGYMGVYLFRLILIFMGDIDSYVPITKDEFAAFLLISSMVSLIFWFSALQILDSFKLLEEMTEKNNLLDLLSQTDKMTGFYNRNYLDQNIDNYMEIADRTGIPISFILIDLDHFKDVNDRYGHTVGDDVLISTANRIKETIRISDKVVRWGGEEFLVLAIDTSQDDAINLAEKLRKAIYSKPYDAVGQVTASMGVVECFHSESQDMCFRRADIALYKAKNSGRNCVISWNPSDQLPVALVRIEWIEKWNSGNESIDNDHKILIELSNKLIESTFLEMSVDMIKEQINPIVSNIVNHFENEEKILTVLEYPELLVHIKSHKELVDEMGIIIENYLNGKSNITELISFLVGKVVIEHMLMMDTRFYIYTLEERHNVDKYIVDKR